MTDNNKVVVLGRVLLYQDGRLHMRYIHVADYSCYTVFPLVTGSGCFQVVDMRWGVRDDATNTHMTTELCLREIKACQEISVGPNFVVSAPSMFT